MLIDERAAAWIEDLGRRVLPGLLDSLGSSPWDEPRPGDRIGTYRLLSVLGRGGMGVVFRAHDERLDRPVALKFVSRRAVAHGETRNRLLEEARSAARLDHPGIAVVHDVGETDGRAFIVMAQYTGETLAERLGRAPMSVDEALDVGRQAADALAAAHRAGIVHRDVKPSNIILAEGGRVKLVDFGIAWRGGVGEAGPTGAAGTVPYMSPEQTTDGVVDARTDVWSLGVVLYEMLARRRPFRGDTREDVLRAIRAAEPEPLARVRPEISPALADVVARCLTKRAGDRFASGDEVLSALIRLSPDWPRGPGSGRDDDASTRVDSLRGAASTVESGDAERHVRRGRHFLEGGDPVSVAKSRDEFLAALNLDPVSARAWSGLSDAYETLAYLAVLPPEEAHVRARAAAERALEIDPDLAEAHVSLATVLLDYYRDWDEAERHYLRALSLDPGYATGRQLYAEFLRDQGRFDEALAEIDEAVRLDPLSPYFRLVRAIVLRMARRYDDAIDALHRLLEATPDYPLGHFYLGLTYAAAGRLAEALDALDRMDPDRTFPDAISVRGFVMARTGRLEEADHALRALDDPAAAHHTLPSQRGIIYLGLGDFDRALDFFEEDIDRRTWFSRIFRVEPLVDPLREHPRFQALLMRVRGGEVAASE